VACYSRGTSYEAEAEILERSLVAAGVGDYQIVGYDDLGDWYRNTAEKARFVAHCRETMAGPLVYVDVDAFVHSDPSKYFGRLAAKGHDFGAHWYAGPAKGWNRSNVCACVTGGSCSREHRMLSGTLFLGDTEKCRTLLRAWVGLNETLAAAGLVEGGGQKQLWYATTCVQGLDIVRLPGEYAYVFDKPFAYRAGIVPVIEHTIASRENRAGSKGKSNPARQKRLAELRALVG
jgi:hypothetical protein